MHVLAFILALSFATKYGTVSTVDWPQPQLRPEYRSTESGISPAHFPLRRYSGECPEAINAMLLKDVERFRNGTLFSLELEFDDPKLPELAKQVPKHLDQPLRREWTYLNAHVLNEPKLRKHIQELCVTTNQNEGWCKIEWGVRVMYYVKFTKSGIGLWQVRTLGFSLDGEDLENQAQCPILAVPLPSYNYYSRAAAMKPLDEPEVPDLPHQALTNTPNECRYSIYHEGLFFKSWITLASPHLVNTNESFSSTMEKAKQTDGWAKLYKVNSAVEDIVYAHYTKRGAWLVAANCSLEFKNKFIRDNLPYVNDQKDFFSA